MIIPKDVEYIIDTLNDNGFEAFIVGGCVRDYLLNKNPNDYDITTNALPEDIVKIFHKTIPTGIKHGTITILLNNNAYEVTTYRIDGKYKNNRSPEDVVFVKDIKSDLSRRDFTINAMAYNKYTDILDFFNGKNDLNSKIIKTVGDPNRRFQEDALRMLRAIRFASQLNFSIEENTFNAIKNNKLLISNISVERINDELCKILLSDIPSIGLNLLKNSGLLKLILPEVDNLVGFNQKNPHHNKDVFEHTISVVDNTKKDLILRLSALFHDVGKPECFSLDENNIGHFYGHNKTSKALTKSILKKLKFDNKTIDATCTLIKEHMTFLGNSKDSTIKKVINRIGNPLIFKLFNLQKADLLSSVYNNEDLDKIKFIECKVEKIIENNEPIHSKDLAINGHDLINIFNISPGKNIGIILNQLLIKVLENPDLNNKSNLLKIAKLIIEQNKI